MNDERCGICLQPPQGRRAIVERCAHIFCYGCISEFMYAPSDNVNSAHKRCPVATCGKPFCEFSEIDEEGETIQTFMFQLGCSGGNNSEPG